MQNILNDASAVRCEIIVGTRPEAIKLAPVIKALRDGWASFFYHTYDSISLPPADCHRAEEHGLHLRIPHGCLVRINDQVAV